MPNEPVDNLDQQDLVISRIVNAPRATLWKAWTDPNLLIEGWRPATPWLAFTAVMSMADEGGGTRYVATVMHPDKATRGRHEGMGFFEGWNTCIDQLEAFARR
jgi:uncharacterized protein YndB with AHSA1/START domain